VASAGRNGHMVPAMTDSISLAFTGSDTGIARLLTNLELAGATPPVTAEPGPVIDDHLDTREYKGRIDGLPAEQAIPVAMAYLATANGHRVWIDGIEVQPTA
jgi:hypothetical protein